MAPHVQTVTGAVDPSVIKNVMHHEHLLSLTPGPWLSGGRPKTRTSPYVFAEAFTHSPFDQVYADDQVARAVSALSGLPELGINCVVDLSPYGVVGRDDQGENVRLLAEISEKSQVYIVAGTAVYLESFTPEWTKTFTQTQLYDRFMKDATDGIGTTGIKAGIFGEQATSLGVITANESKCMHAVAQAAKDSGLALTTHTTHGTMALEQIEIIKQHIPDLNRVPIGHMDTRLDDAYVVNEIAPKGVHLAFDTIGKQNWDFFVRPLELNPPEGDYKKDAHHRSDKVRIRRMLKLLAAGYEDRILLSQDLTGSEVYLNPVTHGQWGYSYMGASFLNPDLWAEVAVTDADLAPTLTHPQPYAPPTQAQLDKMLRTNALRLLTIA